MIGFWVKVTEIKAKSLSQWKDFMVCPTRDRQREMFTSLRRHYAFLNFCMYHQALYGSFQIIIIQKLLLSILNWQGNDRILASIIPDQGTRFLKFREKISLTLWPECSS